MAELLVRLGGVHAYLDDIIVGGSNAADHNKKLRGVLRRIRYDGLYRNQDKRLFGAPEGLFLVASTGRTYIQQTKKPRLFMRLLNPRQSLTAVLSQLTAHTSAPLYHLFSKNVYLKWGPVESKVFNEARRQELDALTHYEMEKSPFLTCDT